MEENEKIKIALENLLKVYSPAELLTLSLRTLQVQGEGWGELTVRFVGGAPILLLTNVSDKLNRAKAIDKQ